MIQDLATKLDEKTHSYDFKEDQGLTTQVKNLPSPNHKALEAIRDPLSNMDSELLKESLKLKVTLSLLNLIKLNLIKHTLKAILNAYHSLIR
ncbi:hypothetical protein A5844_000607 [Enterococcus sp. 10A9_DIV0425]|uniref:Uncharacterized protein n=1 Tax=Candidatus Enterococcus wittei TaxID=1987383 RepID=A0A2C9XSJ0_9ENTE|nr:hypothetical protein A5844_000607 [Enterococcus sp. 10A9_DIV0425]